jgi:hypothetical protein
VFIPVLFTETLPNIYRVKKKIIND